MALFVLINATIMEPTGIFCLICFLSNLCHLNMKTFYRKPLLVLVWVIYLIKTLNFMYLYFIHKRSKRCHKKSTWAWCSYGFTISSEKVHMDPQRVFYVEYLRTPVDLFVKFLCTACKIMWTFVNYFSFKNVLFTLEMR